VIQQILIYAWVFGIGVAVGLWWAILNVRHVVSREASRFLHKVVDGSEN